MTNKYVKNETVTMYCIDCKKKTKCTRLSKKARKGKMKGKIIHAGFECNICKCHFDWL